MSKSISRWAAFTLLALSGALQVLGQSSSTDDPDLAAWKYFAEVVHPGAGRTGPDWNEWNSKEQMCFAGFETKANVRQKTVSVSLAPLSTAEIPEQIIDQQARENHEINPSDRKKKLDKFVSEFLRHPQLSSVLFNPDAKKALCNQGLGRIAWLGQRIDDLDASGEEGEDRTSGQVKGDIQPAAVKLIWQIYPKTNGDVSFSIYSDKIPVQQGRLPGLTSWPHYVINTARRRSCGDISQVSERGEIPLGCFYFVKISTHNQRAIKSLSNDLGEVLDGDGYLGRVDVYAILVGFHMMRLTKDHPNWRWSTFYWTKDENAQPNNWAESWRHFQMMSTDSFREESDQKHRFCYNPYIEGRTDGIKANCVSCHNFAAFFRCSPRNTSQGSVLGNRDYKSTSDRKKDAITYFTEGVGTGFIWSVANASNGSLFLNTERKEFSEAISRINKEYSKTHRNAGSQSIQPK